MTQILITQTLLSLRGYQDFENGVSKILDSYRTIRMDFGKNRRDTRLKIKTKRTVDEDNLIIKAYLQNIISVILKFILMINKIILL